MRELRIAGEGRAPLVKNLLPWLEQLPSRLPPENPPKAA
jgi:hypothetical protein